MDFPWKTIFLSSAAASVASVYYVTPSYLPASATANFLLSFFAQFIAVAIYKVIIYPKLLSPLRHLPSPSVSFLLRRQVCARNG